MKGEVDQIVSEYRRFRASGRSPPVASYAFPDGSEVELCRTNGRDWTLCLIRAGDRALTPVAVGDDAEMAMRRLEDLVRAWAPASWPPLSIVAERATRVVTPAGMSLLLGVVEFGHGALLVGVVKRSGRSAVALLHVDDRQVRVVHVGEATDLRGLDLDGMFELQGMVQAQKAPTRAPGAALLAAFARLLARATKPRPRSQPRRRGAGSAQLFVWALVQLVRMGAEDLVGRRSDIEAQLQVLLPGLDLSSAAIGENLALMLETGTCLITCEGHGRWHLRLSGLNDRASALYKKFCAEDAGVKVDVEGFARVCGGDIPPPRSKHRPRSRSPKNCSPDGPGAVAVGEEARSPGSPVRPVRRLK